LTEIESTPRPLRLYCANGQFKEQFSPAIGASAANGRIYTATFRELKANDLTFSPIWRVIPDCAVFGLAADSAGLPLTASTTFASPWQVVERYDTSGNLIARRAGPGDLWDCFYGEECIRLDVARDNCTLLYIDVLRFRPHRYDVCSGQTLPQIFPGVGYESIRGLSDGGFITGRGNRLVIFDNSGNQVGSIVIDRQIRFIDAIAFSEDGLHAWVVAIRSPQIDVLKVRLSDGVVVASIPDANAQNVVVIDEKRPSAAELVETAAVPSLSPVALVVLAFVLVVAAMRRLA
jgi:hypothetical protein